ncbi:methionine synthase [Dehalobacter sp. DCM]|uniref:methionine synthase n=1 Tax=Dehalobacter sp. DCM TaxID=2907827 RepID=UPI0030813A63|nr:methionine synthase [Dehalobacter sp. DCM]
MSKQTLIDLIAEKVLVMDGAMGTMLQMKNLSTADFGGPESEGCNEILILTRPDIIRGIHEAYLEAGADIIETNTFGGTRIVLDEYGLGQKDITINTAAARLACEAAEKWSTPDKPRYVAGSIGPTTKMLSLSVDITFAEMEEAYYRQALGLLQGGVDLFAVETCPDTLNIKAAGCGINRAAAEVGRGVPLIVSVTIEPTGTMLAGQNIEALYISIEHLKPLAVGMNCGSGADQMTGHLRTIAGIASCAVSCYPNAGLPDEEGGYRQTPEEFADKMTRFAENGWLNIAGGCCGTTDKHIQALARALSGCKPRPTGLSLKSSVSGLEPLWPEEENRPLIVGERANVIGSRKFKELIAEGRYEEGSEIVRNQIKKGAQVIDICVANPDRDELQDMIRFLPQVVNKVKAPLMLDTTDPQVLEAGLRMVQGKAIINSINLENGLERFNDVVPLVKKYGAAVVVGLIDEQGMALTRERKLAVAERAYNLLVSQFGLSAADIIFDPLTFPVGTGDTHYLGSAVETIEGLRLIKKKYPECKTILGVSNVSFGLPAAGREVLNAVFVYHNTLAGLDYAIVNAEKLERYASIPQAERKLAAELLLTTNEQTLKAFTDYYREKQTVEKTSIATLTLEERLASYIVEGTKSGLESDLQQAMLKYTPLDIINGPLMKGMEEVGRLFNQNQLIVAEVLQSAEVMKAAVTILKPHMAKAEEAIKGKILLATVKGDVHDIGKNLVEIILSNNGYQVINLGVKVSSEQLIAAAKQEQPDAIGLSGLLVKSVQQMLLTAQDLQAAGIALPLILGGAALSRKYTEERIAPLYGGPVLYARDAMDGLNLLNHVMKNSENNPHAKYTAIAETQTRIKTVTAANEKAPDPVPETDLEESTDHTANPWEFPLYRPQSTDRYLMRDYPLEELIPALDLPFILRRYLGVKRNPHHLLKEELNTAAQALAAAQAHDQNQLRFEEYLCIVEDFLKEIAEKKLITVHGVYAIYPAYAAGNSICILDSRDGQSVLEELRFPRQHKANGEKGLCLADFIRPQPEIIGNGTVRDIADSDYIGIFALTAGKGIREKAHAYKEEGEYLKSFLLQVLALELAESFAEKMHEIIRQAWGIEMRTTLTNANGSAGKRPITYQGIRVSPGYPIYPDLEEQGKLFRLLKPQDIGLELTESWMMDPEASVTAVVFSHPNARIFNILR